MRIFLLFILLLFSACTAAPPDKEKLPLVLEAADYGDLPGWKKDDHAAVLAALTRSCERILKRPVDQAFGPDGIGGVYGDWQPACRDLPNVKQGQAREFFERWFTPYKATTEEAGSESLFTGYYEPMLRGAKTRQGPYTVPLHTRPVDLVMVDLGEFRDELKGQRIAGRVIDAHLKPYEDRAKIVEGSWPYNDNVLVWVDDPVDAFFLHIQGSGRVELPDGKEIRVGYDGQNGHVYYAIGRELIRRGFMEKNEVSLQSIRKWLDDHPGDAAEIMNLNRSYVFFKELKEEGPLGGEGVALTPERSLAVDRSKIPYGVPLWVDIESPVDGEPGLRRLMMAQDTGGAIRGAVRGDVFWGHGERAEHLAGYMKAKGRYWLLLPKR